MKDMYLKSNSELIAILEESLIGSEVEKADVIREVANRLMDIPNRKISTITSSRDVYDYARPVLCNKEKKYFAIIVLDVENHILAMPIISIGSLTTSIVSPREVFREILKYPASAFIMVSNHPSGNSKPSESDIRITKQLKSAAKMMDILALDHIIIGRGQYNSLKDMGLMNFTDN